MKEANKKIWVTDFVFHIVFIKYFIINKQFYLLLLDFNSELHKKNYVLIFLVHELFSNRNAEITRVMMLND